MITLTPALSLEGRGRPVRLLSARHYSRAIPRPFHQRYSTGISSIETSGAVSLCKVESTDLASPELVAKIVARIQRFNFGPKEGVPKMTILYPIDFLPAS